MGEGLKFLALSETRKLSRQHHGRWIALGAGGLFATILLRLDLFLFFLVTNPPYYVEWIPWTGQIIWWNFPALVVVSPWVVLSLPIYPGISVGITSLLAAIGMAAAIVALWMSRTKVATLRVPVAVAVAVIGMGCFVAPLAMQGPAYWAYFNDPTEYTWWVYAWYLYPLQIILDYAMLLILERTLRFAGNLQSLEGAPSPT